MLNYVSKTSQSSSRPSQALPGRAAQPVPLRPRGGARAVVAAGADRVARIAALVAPRLFKGGVAGPALQHSGLRPAGIGRLGGKAPIGG